jgi:CDP-6-deoxy-D-xylo-4-hexulose-3-dehydrase
LKEILNLVENYIKEKQNTTWTPGVDHVNYSGPYFGPEEYVAAVETLLGGWLVMGNKSLRFEQKFCKQFGKKHGILTNSGSSSNLLMMAALSSKRGYNLPKGTKILTPAAGFPTTLNPILQYGYEPVFVDIELNTLNLDLDKTEEILSKNPDIKVITFAHVLGNPPAMNRVMELVKKHNLILLEDCCDALGSSYEGKPLGSFGEMASCSFYPAHHMTMGEGGYVACNTYEQEVILRSFREWGRGCYCNGPEANKLKCGTCKERFKEWIPSLPGEIFDHKYVYDEIGYNLKPIEVQSAIGLVQLEKLPDIHYLRKRNYYLLKEIFEKYEEYFIIPRSLEEADVSWFAFPLTLKDTAPFYRKNLVDFLEDNLIQTRPYFAGNILLQPAYSHLMDINKVKSEFKNATYSMTNTFFLGTSPVITRTKINYISHIVDQFMRKYE